MPLFKLCGLVVQSNFSLPASPVENEEPDVIVALQDNAPVPETAPAGAVLAQAARGDATYFVVRTDDGYVIRFGSSCDARIDAELRHVDLFPATDDDRPLAQILFAGTVVATLLMLSGSCVLHASAVETGNRGLAFVGFSGGGKSTLAALACAAGARLITDDLLHVAGEGGRLACVPGTREIRLRPAAAGLASGVRGQTRVSSDGRTGVVVDDGARLVPLTAIVFPRPSRTARGLSIRQLDPADALMELTRYPRTVGWRSPEVIGGSFRWNARIAREVPAYDAVIPWGPPFEPGIAPRLLSLAKGNL